MLPIFEYKLTDDTQGLEAIAFVDRPAIGVQYQAFADLQKFEVLNEEKRIVIGAAMIPDLPIYRQGEQGEHYALFSKDTISKLVQKFFKEQKTAAFNEMHDGGKVMEGVYIYQSFITSEELGILPPVGFETIADGTWFIAAKIDNDDAWDKIKKDGILKGFSVEGFFDIQPYNKFQKQINMSKMNIDSVMSVIKNALFDGDKPVERVFGEDTLIDGTPVKWEGTLEVGTAVMVVTPEGEVSAPDGVHELVSGAIVTTEGGMVTEIAAVVEADEQFTISEEEKTAIITEVMQILDPKFEEIMALIGGNFKKMETEKNAEIAAAKTEMQNKFDATLKGIGEQLGELARAEEFTAQKPADVVPLTRAQMAAKMGANIKKLNNK